MVGRAEAGAAGRPGGDWRMGRWGVVVGAVLVVLMVGWFVLSIFVLDVVVADAVNLAVAVAFLGGAAWWARRRREARAIMWFAAFFTITMPFQILRDLATEHRWPAGQIHELLIARRIGGVPALACLAMFGITLIREQRRKAAARAGQEPTAA